MFFNDARSKAKIGGQKPTGYGCLVVLLVWTVVPLVGTIVFLALAIGKSSALAPFIYTIF